MRAKTLLPVLLALVLLSSLTLWLFPEAKAYASQVLSEGVGQSNEEKAILHQGQSYSENENGLIVKWTLVEEGLAKMVYEIEIARGFPPKPQEYNLEGGS